MAPENVPIYKGRKVRIVANFDASYLDNRQKLGGKSAHSENYTRAFSWGTNVSRGKYLGGECVGMFFLGGECRRAYFWG